MTRYEKYKGLDINFSLPGLAQGDTSGGYFCTPTGANAVTHEDVLLFLEETAK